MSRVAIAAAVCAVGLVSGAGAVVVLSEPDLAPASATTGAASPTDTVSADPLDVDVPTPTTAPTVPRGPFTVADAGAVIPKENDEFGPADLEVELGSVCEGATFELVGATPVYTSLQSKADPLQYLDAVVVVYDTAPGASSAYERIAEAIASCPPTRTATPTPTATDVTPLPIEVDGEVRPDVVVAGQPAVQWLQVQSADGTELRTAITVVVVENVLVAISIDEDSESIDADGLADDSIAQAEVVVTALLAARAD